MAVVDKTKVCNLAIGHLGVGKELTDVDTDNTATSKACLMYYEPALKQVLRDFEWPFATKQVALMWQEDDPTTEWSYAYQYPADCLDFRRFVGAGRPGNINAEDRIPYYITYGNHTADADGLCESQKPTGSGNLTMNGAWADEGTAGQYDGQEGRLVTITSDADDSGRTFTITGTDRDGTATSEAITGPNTTTVTGSTYHMTISTIAIDGAATGNITVGMGASYGKEIYCNLAQADAIAEYTVNVLSEPDRFPWDFAMALSWKLAAYIAPRVTGGKDNFRLKREALAMYSIELSEARANAANEIQPDPEPASSLEKARQ